MVDSLIRIIRSPLFVQLGTMIQRYSECVPDRILSSILGGWLGVESSIVRVRWKPER